MFISARILVSFGGHRCSVYGSEGEYCHGRIIVVPLQSRLHEVKTKTTLNPVHHLVPHSGTANALHPKPLTLKPISHRLMFGSRTMDIKHYCQKLPKIYPGF